MRIKQQSLLDLMGAPDVRFSIPKFQRAYSWDAPQCDELWRDIMRAARAHRSHFMGTLIYLEESVAATGDADTTGKAVAADDADTIASPATAPAVSAAAPDAPTAASAAAPDAPTPATAPAAPAPATMRELSVVDGQQRLTTVTLILTALADHMRETGEQLFGIDADYIATTFLNDASGAKLLLSPADRATLEAVIGNGDMPEHPSPRVIENLENFAAKMRTETFDAMELWQGLGSLFVIAAELDSRAQAPVIFESFNSKGVPLVTADLVRNFLLIAENHAEQKRLFEAYWEPITGVFGDDPGSIKLNNAILGWLAVRLKEVRRFGDDQAFSIFKSFCEDQYEGTVDDLLDELYAFCMVWAEHYRYHAVKKYKTADWAKLGHKTRVSGRARAKLDNPDSYEYYKKHFGVDPQW